MDERVAKLKSPEDCERFIRNAIQLGRPDLAEQARRRAVELRAAAEGAATDVERECLQAVYAYEQVLRRRSGKNIRANRTWQMIKRHGIKEAVERAVNRPTETAGYQALAEMGLQDFAFEAVILRHPNEFSEEAVERATDRMAAWQDDSEIQ